MNTTPSKPFRWGILGAAMIARKFWQAVRCQEDSLVVGVASRSAERASEFIQACQTRFPVVNPPAPFDSYEALLSSDEVDAVYIPLPTGVRKEWVLAAAKHGKHVLCEKPCAVSDADMQTMIETCSGAGVQFMDNVMFMHSDRVEKFQSLIHGDKRIGSVRRIATQFSFMGDADFFNSNIRSRTDLEPWGCLGDLGWYNIRMILLAMNHQMPTQVLGRIVNRTGDQGPPTEFTGELVFADGATASLYCSFLNHHQQWVHVSGTEGSLSMDDFVLPWFGNQLGIRYRAAAFNETGFDFNYERRGEDLLVNEYANGHPSAQEVKLVAKFRELALSGRPDAYWPSVSQQTQTIMQALWDSANRQEWVSCS